MQLHNPLEGQGQPAIPFIGQELRPEVLNADGGVNRGQGEDGIELQPLNRNHHVELNAENDPVARVNVPDHLPPVESKSDKLTAKCTDLKKDLDKSIADHKALGLKPNESAAFKAFDVGARTFLTGAFTTLVGTVVGVTPIGWMPVSWLSNTTSSNLPLGMYIIRNGAKTTWDSYDAGKKVVEGAAAGKVLPKEQLQVIEQRRAVLDKLFSGGTDSLANDPDFKAFVDNNWPSDGSMLVCDIDQLGEFIKVFEKQTSLTENAKPITLNEEEKDILGESGANIQEVTQHEINQGKLDRAQRKLDSYEAKHEKLKAELRELQIEFDPEGKIIPESEATAKLFQKEKTDRLEANLDTKLKSIETRQNEEQEKLVEVEREINVHKLALETHEDVWFPDSKDASDAKRRLKDPDSNEPTRQEAIAVHKKAISKLEAKKKPILEKQEELKKERLEVRREIEMSTNLIAQKVAAYRKLEGNIAVQEKRVSDLSGLPRPDDRTATNLTKVLTGFNNEMQAEIERDNKGIFDDKRGNPITIKQYKDNNNISYKDMRDSLLNDNEAKRTEINRLNDENTRLGESFDVINRIPEEDRTQENISQIKEIKSNIDRNIERINVAEGKIKLNDVKIRKLEPIVDLEEEISSNKDKIIKLEPIVKKEEEIRLKLNPHAKEIDKLKNDINNLNKRVDNANRFLAEKGLTAETAEAAITSLKEEIKLLKADLESDPAVIRQKEQLLSGLESNLNIVKTAPDIIKDKQKELDRLYDKIAPNQGELDAELRILRSSIGNKQAHSGPDLRLGSPGLKKWQDKPIKANQGLVNYDHTKPEDNIYVFGTYNKRAFNGVYVENDPVRTGEYLGMNEKDLQSIGRTDKNNFLSNAYNSPLEIPGDIGSPYTSVTHYLIYQRIDKTREEVNLRMNKAVAEGREPTQADKDILKSLDGLKETIDRCPTAHDANFFFNLQNQRFPILPLELIQTPFHDMDNELKKALYCKFVGRDGKPNAEGKKLLATGNGMLYAGQELGDQTYGMQFLKKGEMIGGNKLGVCLMELRDMLSKQERRTNELEAARPNARLNAPQGLPPDMEGDAVDFPIDEGLPIPMENLGIPLEEVRSEDLLNKVKYPDQAIRDSSREVRNALAGITSGETVTTKLLPGLGDVEDIFVGVVAENGDPVKGTLILENGDMYIGKFQDGEPMEGQSRFVRALPPIRNNIADLPNDTLPENALFTTPDAVLRNPNNQQLRNKLAGITSEEEVLLREYDNGRFEGVLSENDLPAKGTMYFNDGRIYIGKFKEDGTPHYMYDAREQQLGRYIYPDDLQEI